MTPCCPGCGSINVKIIGISGFCQESDCEYQCGALASKFRVGTGTSREPNQKWRDPIALTPGGYEDNG